MAGKSLKKTGKKGAGISKRALAIYVVFGLVLVFSGFLFIKSRVEQQQTLSELSSAGKDLRTVYDKIAAQPDATVTESNFAYQCYESSVKYGQGAITCGPSGSIEFYGVLDLGKNQDEITNYVMELGGFADVAVGKVEKSFDDVSDEYGLTMNHAKIKCYVSAAANPISSKTRISLYCLKSVPDFLPGYVVEE